ncbi:unnamed protein product [Rhodiola kirilowii]
MDTLIKTHNKLQHLQVSNGYVDKLGYLSHSKLRDKKRLNLGFKELKRNVVVLVILGLVKCGSSALLELVPEMKKENLDFELPMFDSSKGQVVDLAVVGGGPAGLAMAQTGV